MTGKITELDAGSFDDFVKEGVSIIDFWASWCGPCKMMAPIFKEASGELEGKAKFAKVNVEDNQELAQRFQVMGIPTLLIFKNGSQVDRVVGVLPKDGLVEKVKANL